MVNIPTLYCMCGIAGCGKSSYAEMLKDSNTILVSTDTIRKELYGDESEQGDYKEVFNTAYSKIKNGFNDNKNVIFDATNSRVKYRENLLAALKDYTFNKVVYVFTTSLEQALKNNDSRERKVPERVIINQYEKFNMPTKDEGWDSIYLINHFDLDGEHIECEKLF